MRIVSILMDGRRRAGFIEAGQVFVTHSMEVEDVIKNGIDIRDVPGKWIDENDLEFDVPLRPPVVLCTGHNYRDHFEEKSVNRPEEAKGLEFFLKAGQTIAGLGSDMVLDPAVTRKLDHETELGIVIGKEGRHISKADALKHVFGYVVVNDVTARDRQIQKKADGTFVMELGAAKNFDGSTRLSREIVTVDEIPDPQTLRLSTKVNGEYRQLNTTANMIHSVADIVAFFSSLITLKPGTIISTGTPAGSGWGHDPELGGKGKTPPGCVASSYLHEGDIAVSEIEKVGRLTFKVRALV